MNRSILLTAMAAVLVAGTAIAAPQATPPETGARHGMSRLDANGDGAVDRAEAAKTPRLAERFDRIDANGDGRITADERPDRKHRRGGRKNGLAYIVELDANTDGRISKIEAGTESPLGRHFDDIDANRDGYVVRSELRSHREKRQAEAKARGLERQQARFAEADANKDGRLSQAEVEADMPRIAKAFAFLDENRDGYLSAEEAKPDGGMMHAHRGPRGARPMR
jgi:Ca2+-binding EF-hand superfamily protein